MKTSTKMKRNSEQDSLEPDNPDNAVVIDCHIKDLTTGTSKLFGILLFQSGRTPLQLSLAPPVAARALYSVA
jgi:hypothetical protein